MNILFKKVPEKLSDVVKGILAIVVSIPAAFFAFFLIVFLPTGGLLAGDMPGPHDSLFG